MTLKSGRECEAAGRMSMEKGEVAGRLGVGWHSKRAEGFP